MNFRRLEWFLAGLLLAAMLIPVWVGRYAPLYDYPNHLLEAQVVAHYTDPQFGYADSYEINAGWYLRSNALSTLLLVGLGQVMPMALAGHMVLSLYLILFVGGLGLLLRQAGNVWPLLLLAPALAYNVSFTSGWLNFCYGTALGLYALVVFLHWQKKDHAHDLLWLALLILLIYVAHVVVWMLLLVIVSSMMAGEQYRLRRHGVLLLAMNSALPLLLITRPALAAVVGLLGPVTWGSVALVRRLHLKPGVVALVGIGIAGAWVGLAKALESFYQEGWPELTYTDFDKVTFPLRLFALPHQFLPLDPPLIAYNLVLVMLILVLVGLLTWSTNSLPDKNRGPWLLALGVLGLLYFLIPSRTPDIWVTEPRVLLFAVFVALSGVRLPAVGDPLRRAVTLCAVSLCLLSIGGTIWYAQKYDRRARAWSEQMSLLTPARRVLMLREEQSLYQRRPTVLGIFNRFYMGEYFSVTYNLEYGGFASMTFNNGPVRRRPTIPIPYYNWPGFRDTHYVSEHCSALRETYDAVLFWGKPDVNKIAQLDDCFTPGPRWSDMAIWQRHVEPAEKQHDGNLSANTCSAKPLREE